MVWCRPTILTIAKNPCLEVLNKQKSEGGYMCKVTAGYKLGHGKELLPLTNAFLCLSTHFSRGCCCCHSWAASSITWLPGEGLGEAKGCRETLAQQSCRFPFLQQLKFRYHFPHGWTNGKTSFYHSPHTVRLY